MHDACIDQTVATTDCCVLQEPCGCHPDNQTKAAFSWAWLMLELLAPALRVQRYRRLTNRIVEDLIDEHDCGDKS